LAFIIRIYHDARSSECRMSNYYNNCKKEHILMQLGFKHDITCVQNHRATSWA